MSAHSVAALSPHRLILPDAPQEWPELPELLRRAMGAGGGTIWHHPDCQARWDGAKLRHTCVADCPVRLMHQVLAGRWFLIRNDSVPGYYPTCGVCDGVHRYLTAGCIEKPFNGHTDIIGLIQRDRVESGDRVRRGFRLGALVPISRAKAVVLRERIRARNYPVD